MHFCDTLNEVDGKAPILADRGGGGGLDFWSKLGEVFMDAP